MQADNWTEEDDGVLVLDADVVLGAKVVPMDGRWKVQIRCSEAIGFAAWFDDVEDAKAWCVETCERLS